MGMQDGNPQVYEALVMGEPITQGSMRKGRGGTIVHDKADKLHRWRQNIEDAFYDKYGDQRKWKPINAPVRIEAIITVNPTRALPSNYPEFPDTKPDLDELARAIGDALSPSRSGVIKTGARVGQKHFRMLAEDGRIISWALQKTYPWGNHTHRAALPEPGVQIRLTVLSNMSRADVESWGYRL